MKRTLVDFFEEAVKKYANNTFLMEKREHVYESTSYQQTQNIVYELGAGFVRLGILPGEHIALLSEGRNLWVISELAMFYAGAANVPLSIKLEESNDLLFRLIHSETHWIIVSANQLPKIRKIIDQLPEIKKVIVLDPIEDLYPNEIGVDDVITLGKEHLKTHFEEFLQIGQNIQNNDLATITYTSGTTADPKGVCLSHRNYTANVEQALTLMNISSDWRTLVILPLDHCFAHVVGFYIFMHRGASVATVQVGRNGIETLRNIPINIKEIRPHLILSVPTLAKNFKKNIEAGIRAQGKIVHTLYRWGLKTTILYNGNGQNKGQGARRLLTPLVHLFDTLIFSKVRQNFGGSLQFFIGGGALLDKDLQEFYYAIGIPMYQGYGLSEATPVISSNSPSHHKFGSSGLLVQPLDIRICDTLGNDLPAGEKGEIVIRGENVMRGYWKNETSTADALRDGWLYTGDLGSIQGKLLYVYGRFKSLLIGSDGEKYSPEGIEEALVSSCKYIDQVMLYNNQSPYTVALIVPNTEALKRSLAYHKLAWNSEEGQRKIINNIQRNINKFKAGGEFSGMFPERWLPTTFALLHEPFTEQNQMINSTMKMVRTKVETAYAERIAKLYTVEGKNIYHNINQF